MQIYVTRSKVFMSSAIVELDDPATGEKVQAERELRFFAAAENPPKIVEAPDWIADTLTFKVGIRDKSIVDMTPPSPAPILVRDADDEDAKAKAAEEKVAADAKAKADAEADAAKKAGKTGLQK